MVTLEPVEEAHGDIYLASTSPRRHTLLAQIGVRHRVIAVDVAETPRPQETPEEYVLRLALAKARAGRTQIAAVEQRPVLGADTAVVNAGRILGKPHDEEEAAAMLESLAGRTHQVLTGVALINNGGEESCRLSISHVTLRMITAAEVRAYWRSGEPADKAGGYAIQGRGAVFVEALHGSFSGVMGLPLFETTALLTAAGVAVWQT